MHFVNSSAESAAAAAVSATVRGDTAPQNNSEFSAMVFICSPVHNCIYVYVIH